LLVTAHDASFEERCSAIVRECLHDRWLVSGKDFGRAEPVMPALQIEHRRRDGELRIETKPDSTMSWVIGWDGTDDALRDLLEYVAEEIWGDYCDPAYKYWVPPDT